jgi:hypothetical protein
MCLLVSTNQYYQQIKCDLSFFVCPVPVLYYVFTDKVSDDKTRQNSLNFDLILICFQKVVLSVSALDPYSMSLWLRIELKCWLRIRIESIRTGYPQP